VVRRALAYLLDLALQCAPRGGRVLVGAREAGGGVEVSLLLSGRLQPGRAHTTAPGFAALEGGGGAAAGAGSGGGAGLVSLELAERLVSGSGGSMHVLYPCDLISAAGSRESATSIEVWWPAPLAGGAGAP
ncbi:hypothetical protein MNEG_16455, partial [Monoraphidium neglectum]